MKAWFHDTVSALVYSLAQPHAETIRPDLQPPYNDLTAFVLHQHGQITDYLRAPLKSMTLGFDSLTWLGNGKRFHRLSPAARRRRIEAWKKSSTGFKRDLIRYYESLITLALYSRDAEAAQVRDIVINGPEKRASLSPSEGRGDRMGGNPASAPQIITVPKRESRYEIVVIGSGPGGAITACLLAEAGRNVLLVEEGPFYSLDSCAAFTREEMLQKYRNGGQTVAMGANKIAYVEGRCVGGGSEINSGLYHRTPPDILELWRKEFQVDGLGEKDLLPHFEMCEKELSVSLLPFAAPPASLKLHEGAMRLGWNSVEAPRWYRYDEKGGRGKRQSMTETFVPRFLKAGGQLLPQTRVQTIRQDNGRWNLLAWHTSVRELRVEAGTLFICGGAVQTPALLRRSGIVENVGHSLRLHPTVKVTAKFPEAVNSAEMGVPVHQVKEFAPRISFGCSISSPPYLALGMMDHPEHAYEVRNAWPQMANYYAMITGEGSGSVRALPGFRDPLVRYGLTPNDRHDLADGLRKLGECLFASGAVALYPNITQGPALHRPDDLAQLPAILPNGMANLMTIHLFSSCPMGEDKTRCAVNSYGRVRCVKNLLVADASLLCTAPGVNPQGSIMALARRNALMFLGKL